MISKDQHQEWLANPTGKISKGSYCSSCARFNARAVAVNAILRDGNKVLLVKRGEEPDLGWWDIPGGYLDWNETLEEGASRELHEETGLIVDPNTFSLIGTFSNPNNKAKNQAVDLYYITTHFSGEILIDGEEILEANWFEIDNLPENVAFDHRLILEKLF